MGTFPRLATGVGYAAATLAVSTGAEGLATRVTLNPKNQKEGGQVERLVSFERTRSEDLVSLESENAQLLRNRRQSRLQMATKG